MSGTHLSEIRVDPLIKKEEVIQNNQPQELKMDETFGNNSSENNERSLWLGSIMREVTEDKNNQPLSPKIPKVPHKLRNENEECYRPSVVSIGPYHYWGRDDRLREVETLKWWTIGDVENVEVNEVTGATGDVENNEVTGAIGDATNNEVTGVIETVVMTSTVTGAAENAEGTPVGTTENAENVVIIDEGTESMASDSIRKSPSLLVPDNDNPLHEDDPEKQRTSSGDTGHASLANTKPQLSLAPLVESGEAAATSLPNDQGFDDEQFARMMFLDGCFILQFISCVTNNYENLEMSDRQVASVKRDLLLLENHVPFPVLQSLITLRPILFCSALITAFIVLSLLDRLLILTGKKRKASASGYDWQCQPAQQPAHLLELLHSLFICSHKSKVNSSPRRYRYCLSYLVTCCKKIIPAKSKPVVARESRGHYLYYSAKNLKKVGIHFIPSQTSGLMDVKFKSSFFYGTAKLPTLTIDVWTMPLLLNLVAYEKSSALDQLSVTSYICFMDSLIDDADDVKELRSNGIIVNFLGSDQQVADLFNNMGRSLEPDTSAYNDVKREINNQCESTLKKWVAEWQQTYFHSPWSILACAAAAVGLALTATQAYYTIHPPKKE
ncbi:hypothetical protein DKX38_023289 [Salix brachista]|uniref:Uncharacterized protein n=1 Tax=Salix brachista TaxID=2182728 RepID=A0A5N5JNA5_9ROSI|nr:hypothetical protein DKX38_023289 [Salix brachista]